jgi:hypothetical protein
MLEWMLSGPDSATGFGLAMTAVAGMRWPDEAAYK